MTDSAASAPLTPDHGPAGDLPGTAERVRATMLGAALADALSAPPSQDDVLRITADTQLTLYTMDGLLESIEWASAGEGADETACQWLAQLRWLRTQDAPWPENAPAPLPRWIDAHEVLHADRGHQGQTLEALRTGSMGEVERPVLPTAQDRTAVVRSIAYGLLPVGWRSMAPLTINAAAITHGSPEAQISTTAVALMVQAALVEGSRGTRRPVRAAASAAVEVLAQLTRPAPGTDALLRGALAGRAPAAEDQLTSAGALAGAVHAALEAEDADLAPRATWDAALAAAQRMQGEQPRGTAPLAGALVAAAHGAAALDGLPIEGLDAREVIEEAARRWVEGLGITG